MATQPMVLNPACIKTLSAVEALPGRSNQHEFNGVRQLKEIFGTVSFTKPASFSIRGSAVTDLANVTWYDARDAHPTRTEHRLYFQTNKVMSHAKQGDNILIGLDSGGTLHVVLIQQGAAGFHPGPPSWQPA